MAADAGAAVQPEKVAAGNVGRRFNCRVVAVDARIVFQSKANADEHHFTPCSGGRHTQLRRG
jgi:hypothetical protein